MENCLEYWSKPIYAGTAQLEDPRAIWLDFENWKTDGRKQLEMIWDELGWKYSADASKIALVRSESHKNNPKSY